jgi:motility quorum-sensing regulator/GCU-specific mRNA interferase toxin
MEKRTPAYDLEAFRLEFTTVKSLRMTRTAQDCALGLGLTLVDVVQVVQSVKRTHFYKAMTAFGSHRVWQDVYHVPWGGLILYLKFTVDELGRLILSLKER